MKILYYDKRSVINRSRRDPFEWPVYPLFNTEKLRIFWDSELLIANGADMNTQEKHGDTPLDEADGETADLLRKHGGKMSEELKAEGK